MHTALGLVHHMQWTGLTVLGWCCGVAAACRRGIPLKAVVANCEAKWFLQELQVCRELWGLCSAQLVSQ